jgi:UDP-N-acetylglucosamine--N-acetylmuramyl-(pentapeptide) pyrophosphoryl-undecaprenol N-acetylglucosamine transferase
MEMKKRLSFLSYAVNGAGLGHVVRQVALQKWLRRLCGAWGVKSEHWFLTTSEADGVVFREGFAAFKVPSKSIVEGAGIDKLAWIALAKQWVWHSVGLLRPDVLLVDTFAEGSFHELPAVLDLVRHRVLVQRPMKEDFVRRPGHAALLRAYDRVIVPEHEDDEPGLRALLDIDGDRLAFVGPMVRVDRHAVLDRDEARRRLGVPAGARCVLVTGGGGGDDGVGGLFDVVEAALADDPDTHIVYGAGPLHRGVPRHGPRRTWFSGHDLAEHAAAFDVAVTAAGFNTIHELLLLGVPVLCVPQEKIADDQLARARRYADRGALVVSDVAGLAKALGALLADDARRAALAAHAVVVMPENHAREAALAVLQTVWPPSHVAAAARLVSAGVVARAHTLGDDLGDVFDLALALAGHDDRAGLVERDVDAALALVATTTTKAALLVAMADQLQRKFRVARLLPVLTQLGADALAGQGAGVVEVLRSLPPERQVDAVVVVDALQRAAARAGLVGEGIAAVGLRLRASRPPTPGQVAAAGGVGAARILAAASSSSVSSLSGGRSS